MMHEETTGLCPTCLRPTPATIFEEAGRIWIEQSCVRHGTNRALLASNAVEYKRLRTYAVDRTTGAGCCGAGTDCSAGPPTCVLLLEITQACNLRCPTCYADAHGHEMMTDDEARRRLDSFFRTQNRLDVLMLSGGEPTIHPRFIELLDLALQYPIDRVVVNTNGLRLTQSKELVEALRARKDRIELYFSFGSFRPEIHERLYGKDLVARKLEALRIASDAGLFINLVPTVEAGINDDELGELLRLALAHETICGITYQPVMDNGRYEHGYDPAERLTLTGVLERLVAQTDGMLQLTDFVALPCSHPDCCVLTYGILDAQRTTLTPLPRHLDVARYLDLFSDKISFSGLVEGALKRVWSDTVNLRAGRTLRDLVTLYQHAGVKDLLPLRNDPQAVGRRTFRIVVKPFMDAHTWDQRRVDQCCTKLLNEHGEAISFCEYNVFHRGRKTTVATKGLQLSVLK